VAIPVLAQDSCIGLRIVGEEAGKRKAKVEAFSSMAQYSTAARQLLLAYWSEGYLSAKLTADRDCGCTLCYALITGNRYVFQEVDIEIAGKGVLNPRLEQALGPFQGLILNSQSLEQKLGEVLKILENNGYPFARVWLDSLQASGPHVSAVLQIDLGPLFSFYSVNFPDEVRINKGFLSKYLGISVGAPFDYARVEDIPRRLSALPYLELVDAPSISFSDEGNVRIWLELKERQVSSFDGIIGISPGATPTNRALVTGQFDFRLRNPFARGTSFDLSFEKFQLQSQKLLVGIEYPFILTSPLGVSWQFNMLRMDTSYINLNNRFGIFYSFDQGDKLFIFRQSIRAYPLGKDPTIALRFEDVDIAYYGMKLSMQRTDYAPNPSRGGDYSVELSAGQKAFRKKAPDDPYLVAQSAWQLTYFVPIYKKWVLMARNHGIWNIDSAFGASQAIWIGGNKNQRGYDEGSIPVRSYAIQTLEIRYLLDRNAHAKVFFDGSWLQTYNKEQTDKIWGMGMGYNFKTGPGVFSMSYAQGFGQGQSVGVSGGKVHFGFISYF
jgi:outer membrane protein assembly factor BamA